MHLYLNYLNYLELEFENTQSYHKMAAHSYKWLRATVVTLSEELSF